MCVTIIYLSPYHQKYFLQGANITYLHLNHTIVTITLFVLFIFMFDMKGMGELGFTLTHVSLKYSPSASSVENNVCDNFMKETYPIPPVP